MRLIAIAAIAACGGPSAPAAPSNAAPPPPAGECRANEDCVIVETACCDHCNGGHRKSVPKTRAAAARPTSCASVACPQRACGADGLVPACINQRCTTLIDIRSPYQTFV